MDGSIYFYFYWKYASPIREKFERTNKDKLLFKKLTFHVILKSKLKCSGLEVSIFKLYYSLHLKNMWVYKVLHYRKRREDAGYGVGSSEALDDDRQHDLTLVVFGDRQLSLSTDIL